MRDAILAQPRDSVWIVAIGPLTNIANLLAAYPEVFDWIKGLSIMGGALGNDYTRAWLGKTGDRGKLVKYPTPYAEFNFWVSLAQLQAQCGSDKERGSVILKPQSSYSRDKRSPQRLPWLPLICHIRSWPMKTLKGKSSAPPLCWRKVIYLRKSQSCEIFSKRS